MELSIIIKSYNEEKTIASCIKSVLSEARSTKTSFEIILSDSGSMDSTIKNARKYPIKIVRPGANWRKSASSSLYAGWLASKGSLVYVIDGDMILRKGALNFLLKKIREKGVAGVAGRISEPSAGNIISKRAGPKHSSVILGEVNFLDGGGLYSRKAIMKSGGNISNPHLFAAEESELGFRLKKQGFKLKRFSRITKTHHFYHGSSLKILFNKFFRGYANGFGQVLRLSISGGYFISYFHKLSWYFMIFFGIIIGFATLILVPFSLIPIFIYIILLFLFMSILAIIRRSLTSVFISLTSWILQVLGIIIGFIISAKKLFPKNIIIIKE